MVGFLFFSLFALLAVETSYKDPFIIHSKKTTNDLLVRLSETLPHLIWKSLQAFGRSLMVILHQKVTYSTLCRLYQFYALVCSIHLAAHLAPASDVISGIAIRWGRPICRGKIVLYVGHTVFGLCNPLNSFRTNQLTTTEYVAHDSKRNRKRKCTV